jgi:hypothetical protein
LDMSDRGLVRGLVEKLKSVGAGCVVIDNLASVSGGTDENTSAMSTVMDNFRYLAEEANVAVILIHHQRKSNGKSARAGERLRGHSSIEAHLELALLVERKEGSDIVRVRATKVRDWDVKPFSARFTYTHMRDTKQLETARFVAASVERPDDEQAARAAILAVLARESPLPKTVLAEKASVEMSDKPGKLTVGKRAMEGIIKAMVDEGLLKSEKGRNNAQLISAV